MQRIENDFYPTPQSIIDAVLFHVKLRESATVWEPCAGDGRFSTALEQSGYRVVSHDIDEGHDFFDWKSAQAPVIVTNPPFKHIRRFIDHSFKIGVEQMVLVTPRSDDLAAYIMTVGRSFSPLKNSSIWSLRASASWRPRSIMSAAKPPSKKRKDAHLESSLS